MQLLVTNAFLQHRTGSELAAAEIGEALRKRGHDVVFYAPLLGKFAETLQKQGFSVISAPEAYPGIPDLILGQHWEPTTRAALAFPNTPVMNVIHGALPAEEEPSLAPNIVRYIAVDEPCLRRIAAATGLAADAIPIIPNGVRLDLFPERRDFSRTGKALVFGNSASENERLAAIRAACAAEGLEVDVAGLGYATETDDPGAMLGKYDLVFAKARCALEALVCGCRVILSDERGLGPVVTARNFSLLRPWNFGFMLLSGPHTVDVLRLRIQAALTVDPRETSSVVRAAFDFEKSAELWEKHCQEAAGLPLDFSPERTARFGRSLLSRWHQASENLRKNPNLKHEQRCSKVLMETLKNTLATLHKERKKAWLGRKRIKSIEADATQRLQRDRRHLTAAAAEKLNPWLRKNADPATAPAEKANAPLAFIVGFPRSGTTWLRLMLDAHPMLAIPAETGFLPTAAALTAKGSALREKFLKLVVDWPAGQSHFADYGLTESELRQALAAMEPFSLTSGLRAFYQSCAQRQGKSRAGDKTPRYALEMPLIQRLLPEARFIHLIRDGRDAVASLRRQKFAPTQDVAENARHWASLVQQARADGARLPHYCEVRFENLVADRENELRRLCTFLDLPWDSALLRHEDHAAARLAEVQDVRRENGAIAISREDRIAIHQPATRPPIPERVGAWRHELTASECETFQAIAGHVLQDLGYEES